MSVSNSGAVRWECWDGIGDRGIMRWFPNNQRLEAQQYAKRMSCVVYGVDKNYQRHLRTDLSAHSLAMFSARIEQMRANHRDPHPLSPVSDDRIASTSTAAARAGG